MDGFYGKIKENPRTFYDIPLITIITSLLLVSITLFLSVIYLMGCNRRFLAFISDLSNSTTYAYEHESLIADVDNRLYKISDKNMYGIFAYIAFSKSGRESGKLPEGNPVILDYGDGSVLKLWDLPDDQSVSGHILFLSYTDPEGKDFSYINYKMTMETMMIRYLIYNNVEVDRGTLN